MTRTRTQLFALGTLTFIAVALILQHDPSARAQEGGAPSVSCFIAGTGITLADGSSKPIEQLSAGDQVLGEDGSVNTVTGIETPVLGSRLLYSINGGPFFVTAEHPFMTTEGWKSIDPVATRKEIGGLLSVSSLKVGDTLLTLSGTEPVTSIRGKREAASTPLFNPILTGDHTYFADGYLVHNKYSCFVGDTLVALADGSHKRIDSVSVGDRVLGEDGAVNTVVGIETPPLGDRALYSINGGEAFVTAEHPFMTTEGWKSIDPDTTALESAVPVTQLEVGDTLVREDGAPEVVRSITESTAHPSSETLYNLLLDGNHTYFADGYLVHNKVPSGSQSSSGSTGSGSPSKGDQSGTKGGVVTSGDGSNPCACGGTLVGAAKPETPWYSFLFGREAYAKGDTSGTKLQRWVCSPCPPPPPPDQCANISGYQSTIPAGYTKIGSNCYPQVSATISADPSALNLGQSTGVTWSSVHATSCTGTNFSTGNATSGQVVSAPTVNTTYTVACTGQAGTARASVSVLVFSPSATLNCVPNPIDKGSSCTLSWQGTNTASCAGSGFSTGGSNSGTVSISPSQTTSYAVTCTNEYGKTATANETVTVRPASIGITANPPRVAQGQSSSVTWTGTNMHSCTLTNTETSGVVDQQSTTTSGNLSDSYNTGPLNHDGSFLLSCANSGGTLATSTVVIPVVPSFQEF